MPVSRPTMGAVLVILMSLGFSSTSEATPQNYNFEGLAAGTVVSGQLPSGEILPEDVYAPFDISVEAVNAANSLAIFDTTHPTGNDFDLGTPNQDFGGPGIGDGGRRGMPGENKIPQGKVLIIPQNLVDVNNDGLIDQPNDNAAGGAITVRFPTKGLLHSMQFIDIEEFGFAIDLYDGDQLVQSFPIQSLGDNSQVKVNTQTTRLVDRVVVTMNSSGALSVMTWEPLGCLPPECDISGDAVACVNNLRTFTTTIGPEFTRQWSTSGSCSIEGPADGSSVDVRFNGAGPCTVSLTVSDPVDPQACTTVCSQIVNVTPLPPCGISGPVQVCIGGTNTYSTSAGAAYTKAWSTTSTPAGICAIDGAADGSSVNIDFTGAGVCTLSLIVSDPADPENCRSECTLLVSSTGLPPCNISGDLSVCVGNTKTYTTTVDGSYNRQWSVSSTPAGICSTVGALDGGSVQVQFSGAGACTLALNVADPNDPELCMTTCTQIITVANQPPCTITGDATRCVGTSGTYSVSAAGFSTSWSATSTPAGICAINGSTDGASVDVSFTGAGECTLSVTVFDPNDPQNCTSTCSLIVTVNPKPPCSVSGALTACVGATSVYSTTVGSDYGREWSVTSSPSGICEIDGPTTGGSVSVKFTGAGTCTVSLAVSDPNDPENCASICSQTVTVNDLPPCDITGSQERCIGDRGTYSTNAGAGLTKIWSVSSTPAGICAVNGPTNGSSVNVDFTGAGRCTVSLTLIDPADPENCRSSCTLLVDVVDCTPEPESCWMTGGGCLSVYERRGFKNHTFSGNVGPQPSGSWEHVVRQGNTIEFNFHSWDALSDSCWQDSDPGPCSPAAESNNINYSGTGLYSDGNGHRDEPATFRAHVEDRGESGHGPGTCGGKDYYEIWVYDLSGNIVFHAAGELDCGNLQIHKNVPANKDKDDTGPSPSGSLADATPIVMAPASPNPFRAETRIAYAVRGDSGRNVTVSVFDVSGRQIRRLVDGYEGPGDHETTWDGRTDQGDMVTGGMYFVRVSTGASQAITRVMFVR